MLVNLNTIEIDLVKIEIKNINYFIQCYYNQVLNIPGCWRQNCTQLKVMQDLLTINIDVGLYDTVQYKFPDLKFLEDDLQTCIC
jgi:hypothetical protein